jgi:membrane protein YdbS with pleckstrin-like domain
VTDDAPAVRAPGDPFDPPGLEWSRVSGKLVTARLVVSLGTVGLFAVAGVVVAVLAGAAWVWAIPAFFVLLGLWLLWLVPRQVHAIGYAERADDLLIRKGIMFRTLVVVPYGRMQYLDVQRGPLTRALGLASLQLHTASAGTDASIDGLPAEVAERLRDQLAARGEARLAGL